jgi:hypothetical protein
VNGNDAIRRVMRHLWGTWAPGRRRRKRRSSSPDRGFPCFSQRTHHIEVGLAGLKSAQGLGPLADLLHHQRDAAPGRAGIGNRKRNALAILIATYQNKIARFRGIGNKRRTDLNFREAFDRRCVSIIENMDGSERVRSKRATSGPLLSVAHELQRRGPSHLAPIPSRGNTDPTYVVLNSHTKQAVSF